MPQHRCIGLEEAQRGVAAVLEAARREGRAMAVAVVDRHGDLLCCARMDGAPERVLRFAIRKAYTAAVMGRDTLAFKEELQKRGRTLGDYGDPMFTTLQGGLAVVVDGEVIGGFAVGGNTQQRDEAIARLGLEAMRLQGVPTERGRA